ncbi:hypothetical protein EYZ11_005336 [Aspergillus tanneri]|uniref:Uncharacterized protein n=1 Tax=Aspergillus tanneri TaxID=1220188 RepID=A0A4S3JKJ5_9EURO|nr:hypothetical protein EYZ11_005336 [Aspergillus tanneri]
MDDHAHRYQTGVMETVVLYPALTLVPSNLV